MQEFYEAFAGAMVYDGDPEPQRRADAARAELNAILLEEVGRSRTRPGNSITSAVANDPARGLSDDEIVAQLRVILFGAIETVESTLANAVLLLLQHPEQLAIVRSEPALYGNAIEEGMRLIPPVAFIERWTRRPLRARRRGARRASSSASARSPPTAIPQCSTPPSASTCVAPTRAITSR